MNANTIIDPFADDEPKQDIVVVEENTAVASAPRFDELSVFTTPGDVAEAIKMYLLETYSSLEGYVIAKRWCEVFGEAEELMKQKACNQTNDKKTDVRLAGKVVATVTERSLTKKYKYNDATLDTLLVEAERLDAAIKERKKLLETLKEPMADSKTGELIKPAEQIPVGNTIVVKFAGGKKK